MSDPDEPSILAIIRKGRCEFHWFPGSAPGIHKVYFHHDLSWNFVICVRLFAVTWVL
jgi:hypothetical protein